jgi:hypothetical protein
MLYTALETAREPGSSRPNICSRPGSTSQGLAHRRASLGT